VIVLIAVVGVLAWAGSALLIDAWMRSRRLPLAERLAPFQRQWVADEVEEWLRGTDSRLGRVGGELLQPVNDLAVPRGLLFEPGDLVE
jgi:hypothetical protein